MAYLAAYLIAFPITYLIAYLTPCLIPPADYLITRVLTVPPLELLPFLWT